MFFISWITILGFHTKIISTTSTIWLKHDLKIYLKTEEHQVLVLFDQNKTREDIDLNILQEITDVPTWLISFQEATVEKAKSLSLLPNFKNPLPTTLLLVLGSWTKLEDPISFMVRISEFRSRPKCLMIFRNRNRKSYEKLLRQMWSLRFLHVSVLEIIKEEEIKIHRFNPFTGIYMRKNYTLGDKWFPEKSENLNRLEMKVGLFYNPPAVEYTQNNMSHLLFSGPDVMLAKTLSKAMNFRMQWVFSDELNWGTYSCTKENNTGFFRSALHNEVQFIANKILRSELCGLLEYTTNIRQIRLSLVVPNLSDRRSVITTEWKVGYILYFFSLLISIWIISYIFHFNRRNWQLEYIVELIFGFSIPREPYKLAERIFFVSILISCMMHSSFIYTAFTAVSLKKETEVPFKSIEDVVSSNFSVIIHPFIYKSLYDYTEGSARILLDKSIQQRIGYQECLDLLLKSRNVSCVVRDEVVHWIIGKEEKRCGKASMKIVPEYLILSTGNVIMEAASPYVSQFNKLILMLDRAGLIEKWHHHQKQKEERRNNVLKEERRNNALEEEEVCNNSENEEATLLRRQVQFFLVLGYSIATFIFLCELLINYIAKKIRNSRVIVL